MYSFFTDEDRLSNKFETIKDALEEAVSCRKLYNFKTLKDDKGEYLEIEVAEVIDYQDRIDGESIINWLSYSAYSDLGEIAECYLDDIDLEDFELQFKKFFKEYKEKHKIAGIYLSDNSTLKKYKVYINPFEYEVM